MSTPNAWDNLIIPLANKSHLRPGALKGLTLVVNVASN